MRKLSATGPRCLLNRASGRLRVLRVLNITCTARVSTDRTALPRSRAVRVPVSECRPPVLVETAGVEGVRVMALQHHRSSVRLTLRPREGVEAYSARGDLPSLLSVCL